MQRLTNPNDSDVSGRVLVVDDEPTTRAIHRAFLAKQFDVVTVASGKEALQMCREWLPDLILLDVEMPELGGYETCRQIRTLTTTPIIFATAHQSLEEHLKAYDAGGNDLITKPVNSAILLRKVTLAIRQHQATKQIAAEKASLHKMAMSFLSGMGENGTLLNFMRASVASRSHHELAEHLVEATRNFNVRCSVLIRHENGPTALNSAGESSPLELAILEQSAGMGRIFQFGHRLVVNYDRVSIIVADMPSEVNSPEEAGRIRDNLVILAETAEALCDNVDMRLESTKRAEHLQVALSSAEEALGTLRQKYLDMLGDARMLLQNLVEEVERTYSWLETNQSQEAAISETMDRSVQRILALLAAGGDFDEQFDLVLETLRGSSGGGKAIELF
jgi:DNA-binding response OmpR family regulator